MRSTDLLEPYMYPRVKNRRSIWSTVENRRITQPCAFHSPLSGVNECNGDLTSTDNGFRVTGDPPTEHEGCTTSRSEHRTVLKVS
jgi:hypothetical protein